MNLRMAMCEALVDGWNSNWAMTRVVAHAWILTGKEPKDDDECWGEARKALRITYLQMGALAKTWIPKNMPNLNEALWGGRQRDACIACAQKTLGIHKSRPLQIKVRERDDRHSWGTVK